ncbi:paramyosin-like isoform X2 [Patiria miniata]|uniref:Uncharacterized protein n=1 Tax=Patiria miniata TaxID=46514 RepID=A0A913ZBU2_PATMI|nr:paramyosin-like isoform X2 [Patiria miniata]
MTSETLRRNRQVDLDQLTKDFTKWQGHQDLVLQNSNLNQELKDLLDQREQDRIATKATEDELKQLRGIIGSLQDTLAQRCDLEDENKSLKEKVDRMEEKVKTLKEEGQTALVEVEARLEQVHSEDKMQMQEAHHKQVKQMEEQARALQQAVRDKSAEIKQLQQQLAEAEKHRQTDIVKLRLEYDAKLLKLQSARSSLQRSSDKPSSASSLIFREKMLNAQAASEREVLSLRQTVGELKRKLDNRQPPPNAKRKH